ncbi:Lar family restriction alleviation protein [Stenotrophomonas geniculata]|uniref:Lar family restriction alleviation protein n=1 Tax=Stenotrophomonas geniculata TaxID=86188 RepID=A0ABW1MYG7_9GAMM
MSEIELKACPFCGGEAGIRKWQDEDLWSRNIVEWQKAHCTECDCEGISSCDGYDPDTIEAWNTRATQWQPIESAPKDGDILAWDGYDTRVTHWHTRPSGAGGWLEQIDQYEVIFWQPTHWQPLPAPPEESP